MGYKVEMRSNAHAGQAGAPGGLQQPATLGERLLQVMRDDEKEKKTINFYIEKIRSANPNSQAG